MQVRSLVSFSGIWCCHELWCRLQRWLGSHIVEAVVKVCSCSSDLTPSLGTCICCRHSPKKKKKSPQIRKRHDRWKEGLCKKARDGFLFCVGAPPFRFALGLRHHVAGPLGVSTEPSLGPTPGLLSQNLHFYKSLR